MRIFLTGSTGYVGGAVLRRLVAAGHEVGALHHRDNDEARIRAAGAVPVRGNLRDEETYQSFAARSDVVIHTALERGPGAVEADQIAVEMLLSALAAEGGRRLFVYTSGVWVLGDCPEPADEYAPTSPPAVVSWRPLQEGRVLDGANEYVATAVIRPGIVYGAPGGIFHGFFESARKQKQATFVGHGRNHWSLVHREDLADLYRLVAERMASGVFHGVAESEPTVEELAASCSRAAGAGGAVRGWPLEQARAQLGVFADAVCMDQRVAATRSADLGWKPRHQFADWIARAKDGVDF